MDRAEASDDAFLGLKTTDDQDITDGMELEQFGFAGPPARGCPGRGLWFGLIQKPIFDGTSHARGIL